MRARLHPHEIVPLIDYYFGIGPFTSTDLIEKGIINHAMEATRLKNNNILKLVSPAIRTYSKTVPRHYCLNRKKSHYQIYKQMLEKYGSSPFSFKMLKDDNFAETHWERHALVHSGFFVRITPKFVTPVMWKCKPIEDVLR